MDITDEQLDKYEQEAKPHAHKYVIAQAVIELVQYCRWCRQQIKNYRHALAVCRRKLKK